MPMRTAHAAQRLDLALCLQLNRLHRRVSWLRALRLVSRLGDGPAWYALAFALPLLYGYALQKNAAQGRKRLAYTWDGDVLQSVKRV